MTPGTSRNRSDQTLVGSFERYLQDEGTVLRELPAATITATLSLARGEFPVRLLR
jgi:hypothetical protein